VRPEAEGVEVQKLLVRWLVSAAAVVVVAWLLPGIAVGGGAAGFVTALVGSLVLGLLNLLVTPVLLLLSCPLILLSLGLFLFVINAAVLLLASRLSQALGQPFYVASWGSAMLGSVLITLVTWILSALVGTGDEDKRKERRMNTGKLIGMVLVLTALLDLVLAFAIVGPRLPEARRRVVQLSLALGSAVLLAIGVAFLTGAVGGGAGTRG
jgi:putative membrane protein